VIPFRRGGLLWIPAGLAKLRRTADGLNVALSVVQLAVGIVALGVSFLALWVAFRSFAAQNKSGAEVQAALDSSVVALTRISSLLSRQGDALDKSVAVSTSLLGLQEQARDELIREQRRHPVLDLEIDPKVNPVDPVTGRYAIIRGGLGSVRDIGLIGINRGDAPATTPLVVAIVSTDSVAINRDGGRNPTQYQFRDPRTWYPTSPGLYGYEIEIQVAYPRSVLVRQFSVTAWVAGPGIPLRRRTFDFQVVEVGPQN